MTVSLSSDRGIFAYAVPMATVQIVGYERTPDPALHIAEDGNVDRIPLPPGDSLAFGLGERHCAGAINDAGQHIPCDREDTPWCQSHTDIWICARCRGSCLKDVMDCHAPHVVYLAIVAPDATKVGVTKAARVETRLHEQGADRGAVIHTVKDGRIAREIEAEIANSMAERISTRQKIAGIGEPVDEELWRATLAPYEIIESITPSYSLELSNRPIHETLASGTVCGSKGRLLMLQLEGSNYVTDLRDLVGHQISQRTTPRAIQSGLGMFG